MSVDVKSTYGDFYQAGLSHYREAVISEHFMHEINQDSTCESLSERDLSRKAISISSETLFTELLPFLKEASRQFAVQRAKAAKIRACANFEQYRLESEADLSPSDFMAEVLYDRQFVRSAKDAIPRHVLSSKIRRLVDRQEPIQLVIPALPFKCASPLKCRGTSPDLAEVGFLFFLYEVVESINLIYRDEVDGTNDGVAFFSVISDGRRFNEFLLEPEGRIFSYQKRLRRWISRLGFEGCIGVEDYETVLASKLPVDTLKQRMVIRNEVYLRYLDRMNRLLDPSDMDASLSRAIAFEPDPETFYAEGRFVPLFKSILYTVNFERLTDYVARHGESFERAYTTLTKHIFSPFAALEAGEIPAIEAYIADPLGAPEVAREKVYESLRRSMVCQAWEATIHYLAEIRSDRDLGIDSISLCYPDAIRWTIHAKPGQFAIQSNPAGGLQVQPWHGAGVFKKSKESGIKLCTLPSALLESSGSIPVFYEGDDLISSRNQPVFYVHSDIACSSMEDFLSLLVEKYTRKRR